MICQKPHRQNDLAGKVNIPTRVEVHVTEILDTCRDHKFVTTFQKQHRQNEPACQVDVPTRVEVCVRGNPGHV